MHTSESRRSSAHEISLDNYASSAETSYSDQYILNREFRILLKSNGAAASGDAIAEQRMPKLLEQAVRRVTAQWNDDSEYAASEILSSPPVRIRVRSLSGERGRCIAVTVSHSRTDVTLADIAARYYLSPRETQTLARIFAGDRLGEIAVKLSITSSTVQDHIYHMMEKTQSRNRSELIARTLGWQREAEAHGSGAGHRVLPDL